MPTLLAGFQTCDLALLRAIAETTHIPLTGPDVAAAREELAASLLQPALLDELAASLPRKVAAALAELQAGGGRMPWPQFSKRHGEVRVVGPARLAREKPYLKPFSTAETLFYRGLLARAFFDSPDGPQEFAYIPADLLPLLPAPGAHPEKPLGRPAAHHECVHITTAGSHILDDATTLLAALRGGPTHPGNPADLGLACDARFLHALLAAHGLLAPAGQADPEAVRRLLETGRAASLAALAQTWLHTSAIDELRLLPSLQPEGEWRNDPLRTRQQILHFLDTLPAGAWWSLPAFIAAIKETAPDFQRPDGDYDGWYLRETATGEFIRGFGGWEKIEGALIHWLVTGPLYWLGFIDLAATGADALPGAFRTSKWAATLREGRAPSDFPPEQAQVHIRSTGQISVPRLAPRSVRYLLSRFCEWDAPVADEYRYHATPASLSAAASQGLTVDHLINLLARYSAGIPPNVTLALKNWQKQGQAARITTAPILRLPSAEALAELRASKAARFLGDVLGPAAITLKPGTEARVLAALVELGYLGEVE